jgi:hypothetical protein
LFQSLFGRARDHDGRQSLCLAQDSRGWRVTSNCCCNGVDNALQILQQIDGTLMLPHTACNAQQEHHCSTQCVNVNLQTVGTRRSATRNVSTQTVTSRRNALAALQVSDYPMPMTPTAATSTEMLPMPPLAQTGEVARTEASPAHRNMSSVPLDSKSSHRDGGHHNGLLDSLSRLHSRCMCW